jgi:hypothetical protein
MRQHPELAAKLQSVRPGAAAATTIQVDAPPIVGRAPEFARPAGKYLWKSFCHDYLKLHISQIVVIRMKFHKIFVYHIRMYFVV